MIDDDEKTRVAPWNFRMAAKTVVMPLPPRMTKNIDAAVPEPLMHQQGPPSMPPPGEAILLNRVVAQEPAFDPKATRMALPPLPNRSNQHRALDEIWTGELIRGPQTRMARASHPAVQMPPPPPPRAPGPRPSSAQTSTPNIMAAWRMRMQEARAKTALLGAAALLMLLLLLLPLSSSSANSQERAVTTDVNQEGSTAAIADGNQEQMPTVTAAVNQERRPPTIAIGSLAESAMTSKSLVTTQTESVEKEQLSPAKQVVSEERAASMLLSGRRAEALQLYQQLAAREQSPGVEAMVLVLSQKVGVH